MRMPPRLKPLIEHGVIDSVVRPLMSGKEAQVYLVESEGQLRAAKVYKTATERTFRNRSDYTEGRSVRNSRDQRAMGKRTRHGRERDESTWNAAEADTIYKLDAAGVRVPKPYAFVDGVLVMECIEGPNGGPAQRLAECTLEPTHASAVFDQLMREVAKMLCANIVHGDLSIFNVLLEEAGPVIIDFPQAIDAAVNRNARAILLRDVANLTTHFKRGRPARELRFGHEMWALYERGELRPDVSLTGHFDMPKHEVDAERLLQHMREIEEDEAIAAYTGEGHFEAHSTRPRVHRTASSGAATAGQARGGKTKQASVAPQTIVRGRPPVAVPVQQTRSSKPMPVAAAPQGAGRARPPARSGPPLSGPPPSSDAPPKRRRRRRKSRGGGTGV